MQPWQAYRASAAEGRNGSIAVTCNNDTCNNEQS